MPATQQASITVTDQMVYGWRRGGGVLGGCLRCRHASSQPITHKFRRVLLGAKPLRQCIIVSGLSSLEGCPHTESGTEAQRHSLIEQTYLPSQSWTHPICSLCPEHRDLLSSLLGFRFLRTLPQLEYGVFSDSQHL